MNIGFVMKWVGAFLGFCLLISCSKQQASFSKRDLQGAQRLIGLDIEQQYLDTMHRYLQRNAKGFDSLRRYSLPHATFPALLFDPHPSGYVLPAIENKLEIRAIEGVKLPENLDELAFYDISKLAALIRSKQISSVDLTNFFLKRLKKYNPTLKCAITITEELALLQAQAADQEIADGNYKGLLHGIPYGVKDLITVKGYKTTWGAVPYRSQEIDHTASVVRKLGNAGAVLIAKLTSGALARGDVWFGGQTKNPWDTIQGASGSSAGSGSATSAGLVAFSLGTETLGSITSPSTRNGVSGLRPTYGRVSRDGVMSLSWSMDKVGPLCRTAEDCAIVFNAIHGKDTLDKTTSDIGFDYNDQLDIKNLKIAVLEDLIDRDTTVGGDHLRQAMALFKAQGVRPSVIKLPDHYPFDGFDIILRAEAATMFDELVRSKGVDMMVQQGHRSRANSLRQARFIPAVEYLQANRYRSMLIDEINDLFDDYDVIITPTFGGKQLLITNLTGHPVVTVPSGFDNDGHPTSISFLGNLYAEDKILRFADWYQGLTDHHLKYPDHFTR